MADEEPPVFVNLETHRDAKLEDINEDSDMILVVGDIDIEPKIKGSVNHQGPKAQPNPKKQSKKRSNMKITHPTKPSNQYICDHCNFKSIYKGNLVAHIRTYHLDSKKLYCNFCPYSTRSVKYLTVHIRTHKTFECTQCIYKTIIRKNFLSHRRKHKNNLINAVKRSKKLQKKIEDMEAKPESYQCSECPFITLHKGHLIRHKEFVHNEKTAKGFKCDFCDFSSMQYCLLKNHLDKSRQENLIQCEICDFGSFYLCEVKRHRKSHKRKIVLSKSNNQISENMYDKVIIDGQEFPRKLNNNIIYDKTKKFLINTRSLLDWKSIPIKELTDDENDRKTYQCIQCTFKSTKKESVKYHVESQHTDSTVKPYLCLNCDFAAKCKEHVKAHNKRSKSDKLLECKVCWFTAKFKCQLKMHQRSHRPHPCRLCNHTFCDTTKLRIHYAEIHNHSKYSCELCDFNTSRKKLFIKHMSLHKGEKKCSDCNFSCNSKITLGDHIHKCHQNNESIVIY